MKYNIQLTEPQLASPKKMIAHSQSLFCILLNKTAMLWQDMSTRSLPEVVGAYAKDNPDGSEVRERQVLV